MEDLEYIKRFSKITITGICKKKKIDRANLLMNRASKEKIKTVREEIESEIAKLYLKPDEEEEEEKNVK